jgi:hypothetical protein
MLFASLPVTSALILYVGGVQSRVSPRAQQAYRIIPIIYWKKYIRKFQNLFQMLHVLFAGYVQTCYKLWGKT